MVFHLRLPDAFCILSSFRIIRYISALLAAVFFDGSPCGLAFIIRKAPILIAVESLQQGLTLVLLLDVCFLLELRSLLLLLLRSPLPTELLLLRSLLSTELLLLQSLLSTELLLLLRSLLSTELLLLRSLLSTELLLLRSLLLSTELLLLWTALLVCPGIYVGLTLAAGKSLIAALRIPALRFCRPALLELLCTPAPELLLSSHWTPALLLELLLPSRATLLSLNCGRPLATAPLHLPVVLLMRMCSRDYRAGKQSREYTSCSDSCFHFLPPVDCFPVTSL